MIASTQRIVKGIWIPIEIWCADDLNWNEKILLMEISSFTGGDRDCCMSNEYIAKMLNVTEVSASRLLASLIKKGYVEKTRFDGRRRYIRSLIVTARQTCHEGLVRLNTNDKSELTPALTDLNKITYIKKPNISSTNVESILGKESSSCRSVSFDFKKGLTDLGITSETADAWIRVRKSKRAVNSKIALEGISREIAKTGRPAEDCARLAVEQSWQGFNAAWADRHWNPDRPSSGGKKTYRHEDYVKLAADVKSEIYKQAARKKELEEKNLKENKDAGQHSTQPTFQDLLKH